MVNCISGITIVGRDNILRESFLINIDKELREKALSLYFNLNV